MSPALAVVLPLLFAAAPPLASSEVSPSKILPKSAFGSNAAPEASAGESRPASSDDRYPDPKSCDVVVDYIGRVGFRIADAQSLTNAVMKQMRDRVGRGGAVYEGTLVSDKKMTKMLDGSESEIRGEKMAYYAAAIKNAKWRVKMKFGKKKGLNYALLTCRLAKKRKPVDTTRVSAKSWRDTMTKLEAALPTFCMQIATKAAKPVAAPVVKKKKKKKKKAWSMPPRRE